MASSTTTIAEYPAQRKIPRRSLGIIPEHSDGNTLFLSSPILSPAAKIMDDKILPNASDPPTEVNADPHAYHAPRQSDSRCPCPALNTLANHGYIPRNGRNIPISAFLEALQHPDTYNLSPELAKVLAKGGAVLTEKSPLSLLPIFLDNDTLLSLHHLSLHNKVEHDASIVHKNTTPGQKFAPTRTNTILLNDFLGDRSTIELADVAHRRVVLERVSPIDALHQEIARGEWALVLDVFGRAHGGKIPADELRVWLHENRFPDKWHPDHQQGLIDTIRMSSKIRDAMQNIRKDGHDGVGSKAAGWLAQTLMAEPGEMGAYVSSSYGRKAMRGVGVLLFLTFWYLYYYTVVA